MKDTSLPLPKPSLAAFTRARFVYEAARLNPKLVALVATIRRALLKEFGDHERLVDVMRTLLHVRAQATSERSPGTIELPRGTHAKLATLFRHLEEANLTPGFSPSFSWPYLLALPDLDRPWQDYVSAPEFTLLAAAHGSVPFETGFRDVSLEFLAVAQRGNPLEAFTTWVSMFSGPATTAAVIYIDFEQASIRDISKSFEKWLRERATEKKIPTEKRIHQQRRVGGHIASFDLRKARDIIAAVELVSAHGWAVARGRARGSGLPITKKNWKWALKFTENVREWVWSGGRLPPLRGPEKLTNR